MKILLHVCCAPCASSCIERLIEEENNQVVLFFSNSNLDSEEEFEQRLLSVKRLAEHWNLPLIVDPYNHEEWLRGLTPELASEPEKGLRCSYCFERVLKRTMASLESSACEAFATTLTVSPHKNSRIIIDLGARLSPAFAPYDFKKRNGFARSNALTREFGFYRQSYCGCEFSKRHLSNEA